MRRLSYAQAICEAHAQLLETDNRVFLIGQGLWSPWYAGTSLKDLDKRFGRDRVLDSPVSENAVTGAAIGAAMAGMRPIVFHPRMDFMLLAMDPIVNQAANWSYLFRGQVSVPVVIRAAINRGGEQGAQHSQALHAFFMHVPGLKVVMPSTPYDAKGLLIAAVRDENPIIYIDDRWLYDREGEVPEEMYEVPLGRGVIRREGRDVTVVAWSYAAYLAENACGQLAQRGIEAELIDLRSLKPWDRELVADSVRKTGRLVVVDGAWRTCGAAAEIAAQVSETDFRWLKGPIVRVTLPDLPAPTSRSLEQAYYLTPEKIIQAVERVVYDADGIRTTQTESAICESGKIVPDAERGVGSGILRGDVQRRLDRSKAA
jgi:pyruvate/2-oxoglutarate/acetoin dehydrogenase E1 component